MTTFFAGCAGLFAKTFNAACEMEFFLFLASFILIRVTFGLFFYLCHGARKL